MPSVQPRGEKFQLRVKHRLLPKPFFSTFDSHEAAVAYGTQLEALLDRGIVPQEFLEPERVTSPKVVDVIDQYTALAPITESDTELLQVVAREVVGLRMSGLTYPWAESYVRRLKVKQNLAPGTIRKRVEALARVVDWQMLRTIQTKAGNPLRMLPKGYSVYSAQDAALLGEGKAVKHDVTRDRRLLPEEYKRVMAALSGVRAQDRQRSLEVDPSFIFFFELILNTGLRLVEALRLRWDQLDMQSRVIRVEGSKGHRGRLKPRTVPMRKAVHAWFVANPGQGLVFPFWNGEKEELRRASKRITVRFGTLFAYAGVEDLTEHDLRHEAACRWFELRKPDGSWALSDVEICRIMGWSDYSMILRYASLRGEDMVKHLD